MRVLVLGGRTGFSGQLYPAVSCFLSVISAGWTRAWSGFPRLSSSYVWGGRRACQAPNDCYALMTLWSATTVAFLRLCPHLSDHSSAGSQNRTSFWCPFHLPRPELVYTRSSHPVLSFTSNSRECKQWGRNSFWHHRALISPAQPVFLCGSQVIGLCTFPVISSVVYNGWQAERDRTLDYLFGWRRDDLI